MSSARIKHLLLSGTVAALITCPSAVTASSIAFTPSAPISDYYNLDNGTGEQAEPKLASNGSGQLVVIYTLQQDGNILAAISHNNGATWSNPATVYTGNAKPLAVSYTGSGWVAQWARENPDGETLEHFVSRSGDGISWAAPEVVQVGLVRPYSIFPFSFYGDAESDGANTLLTTFGPRLSRSLNGGQSWTSMLLPDADNYQAVNEAQIAYAGNNKWYLLIQGTYHVVEENGSWSAEVTHLYSSTDNGATWSAPIGEIDTFSQYQDMAARGETVVVANYPSFSVTTNGGSSWSTNQPSTFDYPVPQDITVDQNGNWALAVQMWGENLNPYLNSSHISLFKSTDPASGWSPPTEIAGDPEHRYTNPTLVKNGNSGYAAAYQSYDLQTVRPGPDSDVIVRTSNNAGTSWSTPVIANSDHASDFPWIGDYEPQLVSGDNGVVLAAWSAETDQVSGYNHVMFARSEDYGATWSNTAPITPSYDIRYSLKGSYYSRPAHDLIYAGQGRWILKFDYGLSGENIAYYTVSDDNGFTWSTPAELNASLMGGNGNGTVIKYMKQGTAGIHAMSRLPRNSLTWEEPVMLPGDISPYGIGMVVNTSGQNWFASATAASDVVYTSADDGRTWVESTDVNLPNFGFRFDVDEAGNIVVLHYRHMPSPPVWVEILVSRSSDNGVTWTTPEVIGSGVYSISFPVSDFKFGDISYIGNNTWICAWQTSEYSISTDGGVTWSSRIQVPFEGMDTLSLPTITGDDGRFAIAWQQAGVNPQDTSDSDIYYSFGTYGVTTAAQDWQLFE